jgi:hypothetical protein
MPVDLGRQKTSRPRGGLDGRDCRLDCRSPLPLQIRPDVAHASSLSATRHAGIGPGADLSP